MNCPVCGEMHRRYPLTCIRRIQKYYEYYLLSATEPPQSMKEVRDKIIEYDKYWEKKWEDEDKGQSPPQQ